MGEITIKVPQNINRSFQIDSRRVADEILNDLERHSDQRPARTGNKESLRPLKALLARYRNEPDAEVNTAIEMANEWRGPW